jgi:hypothetical protein
MKLGLRNTGKLGKYRVTKYEFCAVGASILLAACGMALDLRFPDCLLGDHWFMRSGALITTVAVVFIGLDLRRRLDRAVPFVDERLPVERERLLNDAKARGLSAEEAEALFGRVKTEAIGETKEVVRAFYKRLLAIEVILLASGTLIWGLGDIPVDRWRRSHPPTPVCYPIAQLPAK